MIKVIATKVAARPVVNVPTREVEMTVFKLVQTTEATEFSSSQSTAMKVFKSTKEFRDGEDCALIEANAEYAKKFHVRGEEYYCQVKQRLIKQEQYSDPGPASTIPTTEEIFDPLPTTSSHSTIPISDELQFPMELNGETNSEEAASFSSDDDLFSCQDDLKIRQEQQAEMIRVRRLKLSLGKFDYCPGSYTYLR